MGLDGRRVVVTRRPEQAGRLAEALRGVGAEVIELPTIRIEPPESWADVDASIRMLAAGEFEWVAFTSANAVQWFFSRLGCMPADALGRTKVAAVGPATRAALEDAGVQVALVPESYTGVAMAHALGPGTGTILLPRAADVPPDMVEQLTAAGWKTHEVAVYRTLPAAPEGEAYERVERGDFDVVTFASASAVKGFLGMGFDIAALGLGPSDPPQRLVACIGPITAEACTQGGLRVDVTAAEHSVEGLVLALSVAT